MLRGATPTVEDCLAGLKPAIVESARKKSPHVPVYDSLSHGEMP